ncbi:unnamed protein product [Brassica napus]|uniref:(rape) hypothetical protein n=1 Tax=Brassica napus TaxID=3708 RepID=A0A816J5Q1_BRANA|nr:unnamed protein product [Brassica napus]
MASSKPAVRHPSHNHPLRSHKAQAEEEIICSGCDLDLIGAAFKCTKSECDYFLHKSCFELPRENCHKSHPEHPLTLLYSPTYESSSFACDACGEYGSGFAYNCSICKYDVHVGCVSMPETKCDYGTHLHSCAVEEEPKRGGGGSGNTSRNSGGRSSAASDLSAMLKAQREMERMQIELDMAMQSAKIAKKSRKHMLKMI